MHVKNPIRKIYSISLYGNMTNLPDDDTVMIRHNGRIDGDI